MKLLPILFVLTAGLSPALAQVCPDKNLRECYDWCDKNNPSNGAH
ncbi:hypothetical protein CDEST_01718 [Colletotrichum destructivum]|uniref:Uncharacterized protein n=1 Tax=Colletotrichum destructivum TaxID=34406 RepID=A0AAX4I114_9PEZI|nr:hypothetical protein CDEST_01718 [Colletotrichum destructivum]